MKKILYSPYSTVIACICIVFAGVLLFRSVGRAPAVPGTIASSDSSVSSGISSDASGTVALAFLRGGRITTLNAVVGQKVKKGQVLAALDAGDAHGAVLQTQAALDLVKAKYGVLSLQLSNTKNQQDVIVENAYRTLLSAGLQAIPSQNDISAPIISGTYACDKEGVYVITPELTNHSGSGYSFRYSGLESGMNGVDFDIIDALGSCGLFVHFSPGFASTTTWTVAIPNQKSAAYVANKSAYDLAVANRDKTISELAQSLRDNKSPEIQSALGAYQSAVTAYQNTVIIAPADGVISFIDAGAKIGQVIAANKTMISITTNPYGTAK